MARLGFLGLGIMGTPMALNLVRAGHDVTVWTRSPQKCVPLAEAGARAADTPAGVTSSCDMTFAMLADPEAARAVGLDADGAVAGLGDGRGYCDMSTVDADTSRTLAVAVARAGGRFLEAPVSGTKQPAEQGTLVILAAGDRSLYDESGPALDTMGKKRIFLGEVGAGAHMKVVVNMIMGGMMTAFSEGLALASDTGLAVPDLLEVLAAGALANPMFAAKGPLMAAGKTAPAFPLKHMQKDLRLALALGDAQARALPTAAAANAVFLRARASGLGDSDFAAVHEVVADRDGV